MDCIIESYAEFFADLEPAIFGYVASHFSIKEFVAVHEAFTSCSAFRLVCTAGSRASCAALFQ